ncbi:hypothetical protein [Nocardia terpenica]|uniref:Uncharacterized protein n=1 Tax=Nocardia terpenica TaxID=455432 RepID=A0A291RK37_9NOCA|nr:hypothetical protein [Nocardia terpenica]ATL67462.1 hypothetical protein CRH09_15905 [Nocardia terpenica]
MSQLVDTTLLRLATTAGIHDLVFPASDTGRTRIRTLLSAVYQLPYAAVHDVTAVDVLDTACARPLFPLVRRTGNWTQTMPGHIRTDVDLVGSDGAAPHWIDITADLSATVVLEMDPGELASLRVGDLGDFATLDEFRAKFHYFDLDAFLRDHHLSTVDDLRRAFRYLLAEVRLKPAPAFDPTDPANTRRLPVRIAVLIRDAIDVTGALRDVRQVLGALDPVVDEHTDADFAEVVAPLAPAVVFPAAAVAGSGLTQDQLTAFFASQNVLAVFV